jgi:hypothetical protein
MLGFCRSTIIANVNEGLISHWRFDEDSGNVAYDSAGDNDGIIYGATWTAGKLSNALNFDGVNDYVDMQDTVKNYLSTNYTVSTWVKTNTITNPHGIVNYRRSTLDIGYQILFELDHNYSEVRFIVGSLGNNAVASYPDALTTDTWYHLAGVRDGNILKVYVDGISGIPDSEIFETISPDNLTIGALDCCGHGPHALFKGIIDDVRIYDRALSAEEILALYKEEIITVGLDIKPGSCPNPLNVKSKGVLPVAVLGSEEFDVSSIDVTSIRLAGVAPIRSSYEDVSTSVSDSNECECSTQGPDGFTDLKLKFETQKIVETIGEVSHGDELVLELTGVLSDETPIEGSDCIIIRGKHKPLNRTDLNDDGIVDMADFAAFAENWFQSSIVEN